MDLKCGDKVTLNNREGSIVATSGSDNEVIVRFTEISCTGWIKADRVVKVVQESAPKGDA